MHHRDALLSKVSRIIAAYLFNIHLTMEFIHVPIE